MTVETRFMPNLSCRLALVAVLAAALVACSPIVRQHGHVVDEDKLGEIRPGTTTKQQVAQMLGTPSSIGTFADANWYYISRKTSTVAFLAPRVDDQSVVQVVFDDAGVVREVKQYGKGDGERIEHVARETPSVGKQLTLMEQLIGNLGRFNSPRGNRPGSREGL